MIDSNIETYLESCLNASLDLNGESTLTNSFKIHMTEHYFDFIPYLPATYVLNADLAGHIEQIAMSVLYPKYTVFPGQGLQFVDTKSEGMANARALRFYLKKGVYRRLSFDKLSQVQPFLSHNGNSQIIRLMKGYNFNPLAGSGMVGISGRSGLGKTVFSIYLLKNLISMGASLTVIDPKLDYNLHAFSEKYGLEYVTPSLDENNTSFLDQVSRILKRLIDVIHQRQYMLIQNSQRDFKPEIVFIDEALALTSAQTTKAKNAYLALLDRIMLMGRATRCYLYVSAQSFGANDVLSSAAREQLCLRIIFSNFPSKEDCRFLLKDLDDPRSIVLNRDEHHFGLGLAQGPDGRVVPFMAPYIADMEG